MFFALGSDFGREIGFNADESLTQIFWRIVEAAVKSDAAAPSAEGADRHRASTSSARSWLRRSSHPTRVGVMSVLVEGPASPRQTGGGDRRAAEQRHLPRQAVARPRLHRARPGRATRRRARARTLLSREPARLLRRRRLGRRWTRASASAWSGRSLRLISKDISTAMTAGTFFGDDYDVNATRSPMTVDGEGWDEITDLIGRATQGAVRDRRAGRGARAPTAGPSRTSTPRCRCCTSARRSPAER